MDVVRVFDEHAGRYDAWFERRRVLFETEARLVELLVEGSVVEVGVGTGRFAARVGAWLGVDPSIGMLWFARGRVPCLVQGVGEALPLRDCSFDTALLVATLCFAREPIRVLSEAARVARRIVACIIPRESPWGRLYASKHDSPFYRIARFYTIRELAAMLEAVGARVVACSSTLYTPPPGPSEPEEPRLECSEEAGFACLVGLSGLCGERIEPRVSTSNVAVRSRG